MLQNALENMYGGTLSLTILDVTKDPYSFLSCQLNSTDKSLLGDVNSTRFYFEPSVSTFCWIQVSVNSAEAGTKLISALVDT